jgi:hypothetical protein
MIATPLTKTIKTDPDEVQVRNGLDNQRVFDPTANDTLQLILGELRGIRQQLIYITGEEDYDSN